PKITRAGQDESHSNRWDSVSHPERPQIPTTRRGRNARSPAQAARPIPAAICVRRAPHSGNGSAFPRPVPGTLPKVPHPGAARLAPLRVRFEIPPAEGDTSLAQVVRELLVPELRAGGAGFHELRSERRHVAEVQRVEERDELRWSHFQTRMRPSEIA